MERNLTLIALFAALIAGLGLIPKFTLAFGVPITAQTLGVMLCGTVLGAKRGALAVLLFIALVALGLPLLAGGRGGLGVFASPTVGFLVGWPFAAFVTGLIVERWQGRLALVASVASVVGGIVVLYVFGVVGMSITLGKTIPEAALLVTAFIPGDVLKAVLAGLITSGLARSRPSSVLSRG
ncbi:MAG: BioY family transporter [Rhodobacteraceae bacterium]|jgi:biotin transport system substrate-specific component|uniref:Biotin transporter n=1 Tax=Salipiger profundus TaxID=1229727 RepID=A0A1U7D8B5_9RHOB|nr:MULTISPECIES: biotin transporter BioY [Salipiger]APX24401.1 biotin transport system substrate-specific component [Salipiger profundus]MAB07297.1 BioY family transporter [Paracoccaceae bacterium]GGA19701.1 BioY family transporter [Salipiger profundus]SFD37679.1 biotin transport system substrate-specific component [Salipiger profundus]